MVDNLPNTTDVPVLVEHSSVDVLAVDVIIKIWLDDEVAKVNLSLSELTVKPIPGKKTYTGLNSDNCTGRHVAAQSQVAEQLVWVVGVGVAAGVVRVHAQVVPQAVREKGSARSGVEDLLGVALENAQS